ncbi:MAG: hypothetical protein A2583_00785 [Bdellovibrionales bacterium RIFOXYD1_FULL_53_11]|nr:MAG: hypothetical protein A2583_00785 [Bdellovibrionales bacterium RIFOXYD1_FULL_53_11]
MIRDISVDIQNEMPTWPGDVMPVIEKAKMVMSAHCGTHVDAPLHAVRGGKSVDEIDLDAFIGDVLVCELPDGVKEIDRAALDRMDIPADITRILFKTSNSALWKKDRKFNRNFVALTNDAASWLVARDIRLVGVDYLSVQLFKDKTRLTHQTLLQGGVAVLEGVDLSKVEVGRYELICLPLKLRGADGAPARAVLRGPLEY